MSNDRIIGDQLGNINTKEIIHYSNGTDRVTDEYGTHIEKTPSLRDKKNRLTKDQIVERLKNDLAKYKIMEETPDQFYGSLKYIINGDGELSPESIAWINETAAKALEAIMARIVETKK
jgi:hypothetical protein